MFQVFLDTLQASVSSAYNIALALSSVMLLSRSVKPRIKSVVRLFERFCLALVITWLAGTISDMVFPNSISWIVVPSAMLCVCFRDYALPQRLCRTALLVCSWLYSLSIAEWANLFIAGGIVGASLFSLLYMLVVWALVVVLEKYYKVDNNQISFTSSVPVLVVCLSGLAERTILILRSDFGMHHYAMGELESLLTCLNGQIAQLVVYASVLALVHMYEERKRMQAEHHLMQGRVEALNAYRESGDQLRILRHEVKNQYAYIRMLLEHGQYERAKEFFGEMSMRANPTFLMVL